MKKIILLLIISILLIPCNLKSQELYSCGLNDLAQLGDGTNLIRILPSKIDNNNDWKVISCGYVHSMALKNDGTLWAWGDNSYGEFGDGTLTNRPIPFQIGKENNWAQISVGGYHTIALKNDGSLWAWGYNSNGQLGLNDTVPRNIPTKIGLENSWIQISGGGSYSIALKNDGSIWAWGDNSKGQLGLGDTISRFSPTKIGFENNWKFVSCSELHTTAIKNDGTLWTWGNNYSGQLGDGTNKNRNSPVQVDKENNWVLVSGGFSHTVALKNDGTLWAWGENYYGELGLGSFWGQPILSPSKIGIDNDWKFVSCGSNFTVALKNDGSLWTWGNNEGDKLGIGKNYIQISDYLNPSGFYYQLVAEPTKIANENGWKLFSCKGHTEAIKNDGSMWAWGWNSYLFSKINSDKYYFENRTTDMNDFKSICSGSQFSVAIKNDETLWAWGDNRFGQLGDGTTIVKNVPTKMGTDNDWKFVSCGEVHSVAIKNDGSMWAWGNNQQGQLGTGDYIDKSEPKKIGIENDWKFVSCGEAHTIAIKNNGSLWAWGNNWAGQLGINNEIIPSIEIPLQIGTENDWSSVSCGSGHTVAIKNDGTLWAWGDNNSGAVGLGNGDTHYQHFPVKIDFETNWKFVSCGYRYSFAIKKDGTLWAWGDYSHGKLGNDTPWNIYFPTQIGTEKDWKTVECGDSHTLAIKKDGTLWAWGYNRYGQLGTGDNIDKFIPTKIGNNNDWLQVSAGASNSFGLRTKGSKVDEPEYLSSIIIYPNPSKEYLTIENQSNLNKILDYIRIYDSNCKLVAEITNMDFIKSCKLDLKTFSSGNYFIELMLGSKIIYDKFTIAR